jgi:hypothetical protein
MQIFAPNALPLMVNRTIREVKKSLLTTANYTHSGVHSTRMKKRNVNSETTAPTTLDEMAVICDTLQLTIALARQKGA